MLVIRFNFFAARLTANVHPTEKVIHGIGFTRPGKLTQKTMERSTIFHGKIHYFDWAIFKSYFDITRGYPALILWCFNRFSMFTSLVPAQKPLSIS